MNIAPKRTDTIPRAAIAQLLEGLRFVAAQAGPTTYDAVRMRLLAASDRKAPMTRTAMWTVARDVLTELAKLGLATIGVLPRKLSDVDRLRDTPCEISAPGVSMAHLFDEGAGRAYDALLILWLREHHYFRRFIVRLLEAPLYVPDVTSISQLGLDSVKGTAVPAITDALADNCMTRLEAVGWEGSKLRALQAGIKRRAEGLRADLGATDIDAKRLIDLVQDGIVLPAFLEAELLPFDPVTFQQLLKCGQEFFCAAWTASLPSFSGRVVFPTCEYDVPVTADSNPGVTRIAHHGVTYAEPLFTDALRTAYIAAAGGSSGYVSAYAVRAMVCIALRAPLAVFARCLEALISAGPQADLAVYTELPFEPPPQGENYVDVNGRRIGRLKLTYRIGA